MMLVAFGMIEAFSMMVLSFRQAMGYSSPLSVVTLRGAPPSLPTT